LAAAGIQIKKLDKHDLILARKLFAALQEAFEEVQPAIADDAYLQRLLSTPFFICFAVVSNETVAGGLTAYELPMYQGAYSECFIYDIGIIPAFQRMGIGMQLIDTLKDHCHAHNIRTIFVPAHEHDTYALDFYRATGAAEERVVQFHYSVHISDKQ
jgi:aminoglycoside 3-N-acetyltransferase I